MTGRKARRLQIRADIKAARRARDYAAVKGTPAWEKQQQRQQQDAIEKIVAMGHSRARATLAVREYAAAARDTKLGPDWPGWLAMVATAGLRKR